MRIKLHLKRVDNNNVLSINYQHELAACIYNIINYHTSELNDWLRQNDLINDNCDYTAFSISRLLIRDYIITNGNIIMHSDSCVLTLSLFPVSIPEQFIFNLFKNTTLTIGNELNGVKFRINSIEKVPPPKIKGEMTFKCISPICINWINPRTKAQESIHPDHKDYEHLLFDNLVYKSQIGIPENEIKDILIDDCYFQILTEPKAIRISIPNYSEDIIAYKYYFRLKAPRKLLIAGYYSGFGELNSNGLGSIEVCNTSDIFEKKEDKNSHILAYN